MRGSGNSGGGSDRFAYDPEEKPPRNASSGASAARAPAFPSVPPAPPIAQPMQDARYAASPMQFAPVPPPQAPPQYAQLYQQQHGQQASRAYTQPLRGASNDQFAVGYSHAQQQQQQQQQQQPSFQYYAPGQYSSQSPAQQPLLPQLATHTGYPQHLPQGASFRAVMRRKPPRVAKRQVLRQLLKLVAFHTLNAVLGIAAFSLLGSGVSSSVSLLPLCCFGILVFRVVLYGVHVLATLDVMLVNFIVPPHATVMLDPPLATESQRTGLVLAPSLASFSPLSLLALLYFLSVKFAVALLSAASAVLTVAPLAVTVFVLCGGHDVDLTIGNARFSYDRDPTAFVVAAVCCIVIGCALMVLVAKVSTAATTFFCCESFATFCGPTGYQYQYQQQQYQQQPNQYQYQQQQTRQQQHDPRHDAFHANASYGAA